MFCVSSFTSVPVPKRVLLNKPLPVLILETKDLIYLPKFDLYFETRIAIHYSRGRPMGGREQTDSFVKLYFMMHV